MNGSKIAIFGLGRSGISAAKLALHLGAKPTVFDEKPVEAFSGNPVVEEANLLGISVQFGFSGDWSAVETDLIVTSPGVPKNHPKLLAAVQNGIAVISEIELAYRATKAPIIAITGTNGKSTTTVMTYVCLRSAGIDAVLCGNIFGSGYSEVALTEAAMASNSEQVLVAEISSFQLEWIDQFKPSSAIITNLSDDHLNRYESFQEYCQTKQRIFENMGNGDVAVWNSAFPECKPQNRSNLEIVAFGKRGNEAYVEGGDLFFQGESIALSELPFGGVHNYENAMAAGLLAQSQFGNSRSASAVLDGLKKFSGLTHRMERIGTRDGILVINNSMCTNPAAVVASSKSLPMMQHLLVGGVDKGMDFSILRQYLKSSEHHVYLFGTDAMTIRRQLGDDLPVFLTMAEAFAFAKVRAKSGEVIMLAPGAASMDQFKDFRDRGEQFTTMAKEWLGTC